MIARKTFQNILNKLHKGKAILIFGARQVGKTTLLKVMEDQNDSTILHLNGDEPDIRASLPSMTSSQLKNMIGKHSILIIDEAQRITNIGLILKLIVDQIPNVQVIATGSSSFEMANQMNEPLTGRKFEYKMFPISFQELVDHHGLLEEKRQLEHRLIYGSYPEVVVNVADSEELLKLIADSYLFKDVLMLDSIKRPLLLEKILKALALQVGSEVSFNEIAQLVGADRGTVEKYVHLFEQTFIIFQLPSYGRNVRNELKKSKKYYFYDCGIRNAIIGNFSPIRNRVDVGALWENYLISERMKKVAYEQKRQQTYFWRTTQQQEVDLVEEDMDGMRAFEFKWKKHTKVKFPTTFTNAYPEAKIEVITPDNYELFLM